MNYMLIDTETIDLKKRYIYNIGIIVFNEKMQVLGTHDLVIKQIYDNKLLFNTAYYGKKRPLYVSKLKGRTAKRTHLGNAFRTIKAIIKNSNVDTVFAYNASFDKGAFTYTSKHLKATNPLEKVKWIDIQALANNHIHNTKAFQDFCKKNNYITQKGYLKANVEITYEFLLGHPFKETHLALEDCLVEFEILKKCKDIFTPTKKKFFKVAT